MSASSQTFLQKRARQTARFGQVLIQWLSDVSFDVGALVSLHTGRWQSKWLWLEVAWLLVIH